MTPTVTALWAGLLDGTIDSVVSDHSPCTVAAKRFDTGDFADAWGGIASVQLGLPAVWTEAARRGIGLDRVAAWMAAAPAALTGLADRGAISPGRRADFSVFAPDERFVVDPARLRQRNPVTPYAGRTLRGVVRQTWLAGRRRAGAASRAARPVPTGGVPADRCPRDRAHGPTGHGVHGRSGVTGDHPASPGTHFAALPDLASRALGGTVLYTNDEFYADVHSLIDRGPRSTTRRPSRPAARCTTAGRPGGAGSPARIS